MEEEKEESIMDIMANIKGLSDEILGKDKEEEEEE